MTTTVPSSSTSPRTTLVRSRAALLTALFSSALAACGGGGGGGDSGAPAPAPGTTTPAPTPAPTPPLTPGANDGSWPDLGNTRAPDHTAPTPQNTGSPTLGGTLTFTSIGARGYWGRRIEDPVGSPSCNVQSEVIQLPWGNESCCRTRHEVTTDKLSPFNEELALVLDGPLRIKQLVVYQPQSGNDGAWAIRSFWDKRTPENTFNFHFAGPNKSTILPETLGNSCTVFASQEKPFQCGPGSDPYCPGSELDYTGWKGSKLVIALASMPYADDPDMQPLTCNTNGSSEKAVDSPWIGVAPSELFRDGWSGYHPCHCFSNSDDAGLGDGCGQINIFEVIAETSGARWGNRDIISTGIRSYQVGSLGGSVCGLEGGCTMDKFPANADLLDANSLTAMRSGAVIDADNRTSATGPVWRRARDDRYYVLLLDEQSRTVQVAVVHPGNVPASLRGLLPSLPTTIQRATVDGVLGLRLPR